MRSKINVTLLIAGMLCSASLHAQLPTKLGASRYGRYAADIPYSRVHTNRTVQPAGTMLMGTMMACKTAHISFACKMGAAKSDQHVEDAVKNVWRILCFSISKQPIGVIKTPSLIVKRHKFQGNLSLSFI